MESQQLIFLIFTVVGMMTAEAIIDKLGLVKHPEGGFYRETYRGEQSITLGDRTRSTGTAIYYLLKDADKSHFHKVASDELWLFHQGEALELLMINAAGNIELTVLGNRLDRGETPQFVVKAHTWFAVRLKERRGYALVSCVVAPGFEFADFDLGNKAALISLFPQLTTEIEAFSLG